MLVKTLKNFTILTQDYVKQLTKESKRRGLPPRLRMKKLRTCVVSYPNYSGFGQGWSLVTLCLLVRIHVTINLIFLLFSCNSSNTLLSTNTLRRNLMSHDQLLELLELLALEWLGHKVAPHFSGRAVFDLQITFFNLIGQKEITNIKSTGALA